MFKLDIFKIIILSFLILSCSSNKQNYYAVNTVLKDLKSPFNSISKDTIELVDHSFKLYEGFLKGYKVQKDIVLNNKLKPSYNFYEWVDKKYSWILDNDDIDFMMNSLSKQKKEFWEYRKFKKSKKIIQIVDYLKFDDRFSEDIERQKRIKSDKFIYFLSKPVFNKRKKIFIIQYEILLLPYSKMTLLYKKENGVWVQIGHLSSYPEG